MIPLLIDGPLPGANGDGMSLLRLPVGAYSLTARILRGFPADPDDELLVVSQGTSSFSSEELSTMLPVRVIRSTADLAEAVSRRAPTDRVCVMDVRRVPERGVSLRRIARRYAEYPGVVHVVGIGADADEIRETVESDNDGNVVQIQRSFPLSTPTDAVEPFATMIPVHLCSALGLTSLEAIRVALELGGNLSMDVYVPVVVHDLTMPRGLLALHGSCKDAAPPGFRTLRRGGNDHCVVSNHCSLAASVRLQGSIVVHEGAVIESGATLLGPVTVGPGCRVGRSAVVANSVLRPKSVVPPRGVVSHEPAWSGERTRRECSKDETAAVGQPESTVSRFSIAEMSPALFAASETEAYLSSKRMLDIILTLLGLLVLSPVLLVIAVLIKVDSSGPVFFVHRREGRGGKEFPCLKFRTMAIGAHRRQTELAGNNQVDGPQFKIDHDPRVTRLGRFLRATNIDELPQLFNVLVGQMSLVGPRPSPFRENQICVPWRRARLSVRPGITGLWQLCRDRSQRADFHQWIYFDLEYVRRRSLLLDVKLLALTLLTLGGKRAVPVEWLVRESRPQAASAAVLTLGT